MLTNSQDILFITLAVCAAAITLFVCWGLYYALIPLREIRQMVGAIKKCVDSIIAFVDETKQKAQSSAETVTAISKAVIDVVGYVKTKAREKEKKRNLQDQDKR